MLWGSNSTSSGIASPYVPLDDPVYEFLDKCAVKGLLSFEIINQKPLSRRQVGQNLILVSNSFAAIEDRILEKELDYFLREFAWDIESFKDTSGDTSGRQVRYLRSTRYSPTEALKNPHWHLSMIRNDDFQIILNPMIWGRIDAAEDQTVMRRGSGLQFHGNLTDRLGFYFQFVDRVERGNGPYINRDYLISDTWGYVGPLGGGNETYYDLTEAHLTTRWKYFSLFFGKDRLKVGPGREDGLLFSGNFPSFNQVRIDVEPIDGLKFTQVIGKLQPWNVPVDTLYQTDDGYWRLSLQPKWLAFHRLQYVFDNRLTIGINEAVIWGERGIDMAYVNPLNFYFSAEHDGDDQDNVLLSMDVSFSIMNRAVIYSEFLIDDIKTSSLGDGYPGNKLGVIAGVWLVDTGIDGFATGLEYTRLEPYVYGHFYPVNRYTTWTSCLGSELKANSDRLRWTLDYSPVRQIKLKALIDHRRQGSRGSDIWSTFSRNKTEVIHFLDGDLMEWTALDGSISWEPVPGVIFRTGYIANDKASFLRDRLYFEGGYRF